LTTVLRVVSFSMPTFTGLAVSRSLGGWGLMARDVTELETTTRQRVGNEPARARREGARE
jgi:hypothetical protein